MKIKELIKVLNYELNSTGNSEVLISVDLNNATVINNTVTTNITATEIEIPGKFIIKNYVM
jgi:hypothetical protein